MEDIMIKSARGELRKIVEDCQRRLDGGIGTEYDQVMTKVAEYINAIEQRLCFIELEKQYYLGKHLSAEEKQRVIAYELSVEGSGDE